jgi:hypothetical protein
VGRWLCSLPVQHGEQAEHGGRLLERDLVVAAVANVPADRGSPELSRFSGEDQEGELYYSERCSLSLASSLLAL